MENKNQELDYLIMRLDYMKLKLAVLDKDIKETRTIRLLKNIISDSDILDIIEIIDTGIGFSSKTPDELHMTKLELITEINELYQEINRLDTKYFYFISTLTEQEKLKFYGMTEIEKKEYRIKNTVISDNDLNDKEKIYDAVSTVKRRQLELKKKGKIGKIIDILKDK